MPAAIDTTDGVSAFASFREAAWHKLGEVFTDEVTDYKVMLERAHLADWNVRLAEVEVSGIPDARISVPQFAVIRDNPVDNGTDVLGWVGGRYTIVQNEEAFAFLQSLQDGARWETAGSIKDGSVVFGSLAFDREIVLDPNGVADTVKSYLLVYHSFDGSTAISGGVTPVRVVCQNTLNLAISTKVKQSFKIRHTQKVEDRMKAAAETWRATHTYLDAFEVEARNLLAKPVTDNQYNGMLNTLFPKPEVDAKGAVKKWESRMETFTQPWKNEANAGIRGTGWGALNALTEANQWGRRLRAGNVENFAAAGAGFDGPTNEFRNKALSLVKAL